MIGKGNENKRSSTDAKQAAGHSNDARAARTVGMDASTAKARRGAHAKLPVEHAPASTSVMPVDPSRRTKGNDRLRHPVRNGAQQPGPDAASGANGAFQQPRKSKAGKAVAITLAAILLLIAVVYVAGAVVFTGRFYPNTSMGRLDLSMKSAEEASALLAEAESDYVLLIKGQGLDFEVSSADAGVGVDARSIIDAALGDSDPWKWPLRIAGMHDETERMVAASDTDALASVVQEAVDAFNETATPSEDAYVAFDEDAGAYTVYDEIYGDQVSAESIVEAATKAIASMQETLSLEDDVLIMPSVLSDDARLTAAADKANVMIGCDVVLTAATDGTEISELDGSIISQWITFDENLEPVLDSAALDAWTQELAGSLNTVGTMRSYTRPDGKHVEIGGGTYGWQVDSAALASAVRDAVDNGTVGELSIPCSVTGNGYTAPGQDWGAYCDIDLTEQHAYYYDATGGLVWDAPIVSGKPTGEDDTPTGVYYLNSLQRDVSLKGPIDPETNKPEWDSPVDYWMPFVGNMVGLHDAPWQPSSVFGNAQAYKTYGSHGCVNLSVDTAAALFGIIQIGDPVIVHW